MSSQQSNAEQVLYHPPKSMAFGHYARGRSSRTAWEALERFLERHTISSLRDPVEFQCPLPGGGLDEDVAAEYLDYVREHLGMESDSHIPYHVWSVGPELLPLCLELAFGENRWPKQRYGPASLTVCFDFTWRRAAAGAASVRRDHLPNEVPRSSSLNALIGGQRLFVQPMFFFPFSWDSTEVKELLESLSADMPFQFGPHHFQRAIPSKKGNSYRTLKLPKDWFRPNKPMQRTCEDARR